MFTTDPWLVLDAIWEYMETAACWPGTIFIRTVWCARSIPVFLQGSSKVLLHAIWQKIWGILISCLCGNTKEVFWMDLNEVTLRLIGHLTDCYLAVCAASQDPDHPLRHDVQAVTRSVVQAVPASSLACVMSIGGVSGMTIFLVRVFPHHLRLAQAWAQRPSAKGPAEVWFEAQGDQGVIKGGGFSKHSRCGKCYRRNCIRIHKRRPHGYSSVRTPCYQEAYAYSHGELRRERRTIWYQ